MASYVFYGWWDYRFLALILFSSVVDYIIALKIEEKDSKKAKRILLITSLMVNLGLLGYFKYSNFFISNFNEAFSFFGISHNLSSLKILLPVGISFYTFQTLSYTIDVFRGSMKAERDFTTFAAYVSFFPQLVAGPIERATNLLPQFGKNRTFNYASAADGSRQILWGFVKKIVIADNAAQYADTFFNDPDAYGGSGLLLGALFFAFQIYGDFSGYSDIAIGTAKLFGFNLMKNFAFPYFSRDIAEFWRRWHISLSTWFRDYLYIPLGGSAGSNVRKFRNVLAIFLVSGFWHGANWTYLAWGLVNALYFLPLLFLKRNRVNMNDMGLIPTFRESLKVIVTFVLVVLAWILFRAENITVAVDIYQKIFSSSLLEIPEFSARTDALLLLLIIMVFMAIEWLGKRNSFAIQNIKNYRPVIRWSFYILIFAGILLLGHKDSNVEFIYFQF